MHQHLQNPWKSTFQPSFLPFNCYTRQGPYNVTRDLFGNVDQSQIVNAAKKRRVYVQETRPAAETSKLRSEEWMQGTPDTKGAEPHKRGKGKISHGRKYKSEFLHCFFANITTMSPTLPSSHGSLYHECRCATHTPPKISISDTIQTARGPSGVCHPLSFMAVCKREVAAALSARVAPLNLIATTIVAT